MTEAPLFELPGRLRSRWTERRAAEVRAVIERRVRRRRLVRRAVAASALGVAGCLLSVFLLSKRDAVQVASSTSIAIRATAPHPTLREPTATPLTADTELVVDPGGAGRAYVLRRGSARFVVAHDERRPFRVRVGPLVIEDLGTVFSVSRLSEREFDVSVEDGNVAVVCGEERAELGRGNRRTFECGKVGEDASAEPEPRSKAPPETVPPKAAARQPSQPETDPRPEPEWRSLAERGQYAQAYDSLRSEGRASVRDETHELLLAADTARLSGHPSEAVPYLRRVLSQHGTDPRAALTAFTLGRVLLDELGRPAEAASAFERARANSSPLAEDALAREVEAWARAGDTQRAHALALAYRRNYPEGRRTRVVVKFGGLE